jgi:hypothetical protein
MTQMIAEDEREELARLARDQIIDPRAGDIGNDHSATKQRSLLAIAGSMLAEISVGKLLFAWFVSIVVPGILLGLAPLAITAWVGAASDRIAQATGYGVVVLVVVAAGAAAWFGGRPMFRLAENNFWSLNALAVQPGYALWREGLRHLSERSFGGRTGAKLARMRAWSCAAAGVLLFLVAALVTLAVWPATRWVGTIADVADPARLILPTLANALALMSAYLAIAALVWGFADATADQPLDLEAFDAPRAGERIWRVVHLSDVHCVGERYGFRIESGRAGPRGNANFERVMRRIADIHAAEPLDLVLITGDMTDAGISAEWAEFLDIIEGYPQLAERMLILPGNHDVNIVDRANPARLDLPFSPSKTLRKMRALSAIAAVQGERVLAARGDGASGPTLSAALEPKRRAIEAFADEGGFGAAARLSELWDETFPLILPPEEEDGLGVAVLNTNADTNFSFTNALGLISLEEANRLKAAFDAYPKARWLVAMHHHPAEYPRPVAAFSERVGTALVNGSWFLRVLKPYASRLVVMHGHRHIDWIGACGALKIVSAPSPVMGRPTAPRYFYIHSLSRGPNGAVSLLKPQRVDL